MGVDELQSWPVTQVSSFPFGLAIIAGFVLWDNTVGVPCQMTAGS